MSPVSGRERLIARVQVVLAAVCWGTSATLARHVFRDLHVPALTVVVLRLTIAAAILLPFWLARGRHRETIPARTFGQLLILGVFGVAFIQASYYYSIAVLGVGHAILLQYLAPSLIVAWGFLRGAPPRAVAVAAVLTAVAGTALLVGGGVPTHDVRPWQWAIGFSAAVGFAFYIVYSKRVLAKLPPDTVLLLTFVVAGVLWSIVTPPWRILAAGYPAGTWLAFVALGVFSTLVPFTLFYAGLRRLPPDEAGIIATLEPVVAVTSAALFLRENLSLSQWAGAGLVLLATILAGLPGRRTRT